MKFNKKILQILMLTLSAPILVNNCLANSGSISTSVGQTDLQNILTNLDNSKKAELISNSINPANKDLSYSPMNTLVSKESLETIQPIVDISMTVLKMVAMYYIGQHIMMPAFGQLTGSIGNLYNTKYVVNTCSNWAKYRIMTTSILKNLGTVGVKFAQFAALTGAMAYVQNKFSGEKEAQISQLV